MNVNSEIKIIVYKESGILPYSTVRHSECELLQVAAELRCSSCTRYRSTLRSLSVKNLAQDIPTPRVTASSHVNYRFLSTPEKVDRLHYIHTQYRNVSKKLFRLSAKISESIARDGVLVDEELHKIFQQLSKKQVLRLLLQGTIFHGFFGSNRRKLHQLVRVAA